MQCLYAPESVQGNSLGIWFFALHLPILDTFMAGIIRAASMHGTVTFRVRNTLLNHISAAGGLKAQISVSPKMCVWSFGLFCNLPTPRCVIAFHTWELALCVVLIGTSSAIHRQAWMACTVRSWAVDVELIYLDARALSEAIQYTYFDATQWDKFNWSFHMLQIFFLGFDNHCAPHYPQVLHSDDVRYGVKH